MTLPAFKRPTYARHYEDNCQLNEANGSRTWITRGANLVVSVTQAAAGTTLVRDNNPDEYMLILPDETGATLTTTAENVSVHGNTLNILPPGRSEVMVSNAGTVVRIFSNRAHDLCELSINAETYAAAVDGVAPLENWPDPIGGFKIRSYDLRQFLDEGGPMIQPRLFRSTNLMVNVFAPWHKLRDTTKLGPHWHDDFEQASLAVRGTFVHHIRYPWNSDLSDWLPDEHTEIGSPSVTIIPPPLVHTTRNLTTDDVRLIDIFAPPRIDFSLRPGFVINAKEYPMPTNIEADNIEMAANLSSWSKS
ncbi:hypothetical protein G6L99_32235 [Agrobacterium rhizogenes]|uniref:hypothetical protein n=1 Tax=Rhizobium rhizogenes TaxID=359 RepID=UPI0015745706|nr:hypothetical protein [Rhizobium rhizogenes]NTH16784.1 hypothetical protein [Rhizobium rhizogenes]